MGADAERAGGCGDAARPVVGVFVGGASRRMGGRPKGLLYVPGSTTPIVAHLVAEASAAGLDAALVGRAVDYAGLAPGCPRLADDPAGIGPLGGLRALLRFAGARPALAIGCDMPRVAAPALHQLATQPSPAAIVAARRGPRAPWEPLFARYDAPRVLPALDAALAEGVRSFQALFGRLEVEPARGIDPAALTDWDAPDDVAR